MRITPVSDHDARIAALIVGELPVERAVESLAERDAVPAIAAALVSGGVSAGLDRRRDGVPGWRAALARALAIVGDPRAENVLVTLMEGGDALERAEAALALESCRRVQPVDPGRGRRPQPALEPLAAQPLPA